jgi:hypothetical protein
MELNTKILLILVLVVLFLFIIIRIKIKNDKKRKSLNTSMNNKDKYANLITSEDYNLNIKEAQLINQVVSNNLDNIQTKDTHVLGKFRIEIANESLTTGEKIFRFIGLGATASSMLREAELIFNDQGIILRSMTDLASVQELKNFTYEEIKKVKYEKEAIYPAMQLIKPMLSGFFFGIGLFFYLLIKTPANAPYPISPLSLFAISVITMIFLFVFINLFSIRWYSITELSFWGSNEKILAFAMKDNLVDSFLSMTKSKNI